MAELQVGQVGGELSRGRRRWLGAACAAVVFATALAARWRWGANLDGPNFQPKPDAVEYAASAMALVQTGRFYLQVGPVQAEPHYSPGWPSAIAAALELGTDPQQVWRLTGLLGAALAVALAAAAGWTARALSPAPAGRAFWGGMVAALLAGIGWALAPCAVAVGRTLLSDEPAAFAAVSSLLLLLGGLARTPATGTCAEVSAGDPDSRGAAPLVRGGRPALWYCAAGLAFGITTAFRPVEGALLAVPELLLVAGTIRKLRSPRSWLPLLACWCGGAAMPALGVDALLMRSGRSPLAWTGYDYWWPSGPGHLLDAFSWRNAWTPEPMLALLGLPGLPADWYLGPVWPLLGWLAALWLWTVIRARSRRDPRRQFLLWALAALALWTVARVVLFACYFATAARFFLPAQAVVLLALAAGIGLATAGGGSGGGPRRRRIGGTGVGGVAGVAGVAGLVGAACLLVLLVASFVSFSRHVDLSAGRTRTYRAFNRWIQLSDEERARAEVPFDPLDAQALGLLDPDIVADIHQWGELPATYHVRRLRKKGLLPP
jgi:4-amino-4-deoxy-L-arabinose transferase-like glycosyltransferase